MVATWLPLAPMVVTMWEDADDTTRLWILFEVNDRGKADGWLKRAVADTHGPTAAVTGSQAHFLRTA